MVMKKNGLTSDLTPLPAMKDGLFSTAEDWWNNACLNFFHDGWSIYTIGYKDAADSLVEQVETTGRGQDALVYPIVFLYRQYLELAIKDLIRHGYRLQGIKKDFPKTHDISKLWIICSGLLEQISPGDSKEELKQIGRLISEFCSVDPTSEAFRYPEDKAGNHSLSTMVTINLRNLKEVIAKIAVILDGADAVIDNYLSIRADFIVTEC
jgi:hypothetical protein